MQYDLLDGAFFACWYAGKRMTRERYTRSDVVYNFGRVCPFVCLSEDNFRKL